MTVAFSPPHPVTSSPSHPKARFPPPRKWCILSPMDHPAILSTLDGVTTVLVAFIFVCLIFPSIVKNRPQYYAALAMIIFILLLHTMTLILYKSYAIVVAGGVFTGLLQICALLL